MRQASRDHSSNRLHSTRQASRDQSRLPGEAAATLTFSSRASSLPRPGPTTRACSRGSHCSISWTASGLSLNKRRVGGLFLCSFPLLIQLQTLADFPQGPFPVPGPEPGLLQDPPLGSPLGCKMPSWPPPRPLPPNSQMLRAASTPGPPPTPTPLSPSLNTIHPALLLRRAPPGPDKRLPVRPLPLLGPKGLFSAVA